MTHSLTVVAVPALAGFARQVSEVVLLALRAVAWPIAVPLLALLAVAWLIAAPPIVAGIILIAERRSCCSAGSRGSRRRHLRLLQQRLRLLQPRLQLLRLQQRLLPGWLRQLGLPAVLA